MQAAAGAAEAIALPPCLSKPILTLRSQNRRWEGALGAALLVQAAAGAAEAIALPPCLSKPILTLRSQNRRWEGALGAALLVQAAAGAAEAVALHRLRRQVRRHQQRGRLRSTQVPSWLQSLGFCGYLFPDP